MIHLDAMCQGILDGEVVEGHQQLLGHCVMFLEFLEIHEKSTDLIDVCVVATQKGKSTDCVFVNVCVGMLQGLASISRSFIVITGRLAASDLISRHDSTLQPAKTLPVLRTVSVEEKQKGVTSEPSSLALPL